LISQVEQDFAQIAAAGLNWVRLPIPYWFIETMEGEPFLEGVGWKYVLKAMEWARKCVRSMQQNCQ
jgi:glucan 1,3-beta-glucosidase